MTFAKKIYIEESSDRAWEVTDPSTLNDMFDTYPRGSKFGVYELVGQVELENKVVLVTSTEDPVVEDGALAAKKLARKR